MMQKYPVPVVRVILEDEHGRVLLIKRANTNYEEGKYCLPGGKVDYGNTREQTCISEAKEETNLDISDITELFDRDGLPASPGGMHVIDHYFYAKHSGDIKLNRESSEYRWAHPNELHKYAIAFKNDEAIKRWREEYRK